MLTNIPPFKISSTNHITPHFSFSPTGRPILGWAPIKSLDAPIASWRPMELTLCIHYPFYQKGKGRKYFIVANGPNGISVQEAIAAIRRGYRHLFRHASSPAEIREVAATRLGFTSHKATVGFSSLFVTGCEIDEVSGELAVSVEGYPVPVDENLPF